MTELEIKTKLYDQILEKWIYKENEKVVRLIDLAEIFNEFSSPVEPVVSHQDQHTQLHKCFDELLADFIKHNPEEGLNTSITKLMQWTYEQTKAPTE